MSTIIEVFVSYDGILCKYNSITNSSYELEGIACLGSDDITKINPLLDLIFIYTNEHK